MVPVFPSRSKKFKFGPVKAFFGVTAMSNIQSAQVQPAHLAQTEV